jgi:single-strand DNA-binding protein
MKNIVISGNCTKDAELRTTQGGSQVAGFAIAVNGFANGEKTTTFFDVSMWGKRGEAIMQFAKRGAKMCVAGELSTRDHNGKTYLTVNASDFTPMGGPQGGGQSDGGGQSGDQGGYGSGGQSDGGYGVVGGDMDGDAIPF